MPKAPCGKSQTGKCLGGACQNHAMHCSGSENVCRQPVRPTSYNIEDALIDAFDAGLTTDDIMEALPRAAP